MKTKYIKSSETQSQKVHENEITSLIVDNNEVISGSKSGAVKVLDTKTFKEKLSFQAGDSKVTALLTHTSEYLLVGFQSGDVKLFNRKNGQFLSSGFEDNHKKGLKKPEHYRGCITQPVSSIFFSQFRQAFFVIYPTCFQKLTLTNYKNIPNLDTRNSPVPGRSCTLNHGGSTFALIEDSTYPYKVKYKDHQIIYATSSNTENIDIYKRTHADFGNELITTLKGHSDKIYTLCLLKKDIIASLAYDNTLRIWNIAQKTCIEEIKGISSKITIIAQLPNGYYLFGTKEGELQIPTLSEQNLITSSKTSSKISSEPFIITPTIPKTTPLTTKKKTDSVSFSLIPYSDIKVCKDTSNDPIVLGQGGFGIVYKATWKNKDAAFKELLAQNINPDIEEEFAKETNVMMQLKHENIIKLYGICLSPKHYGMLMEFMPKGSLFDVLQSGISLSWKQRYDMAYDITAGLQYLHNDQNILHRDLKSLNVLVGDNLRLKISDFGLARIKFSSSMPTLDKQVGTLRWMAPELCNTKPHYTKACDIYSYSIILWEITSRKIPWSDAVNQFEIMLKLMGGEREKIPEKTPISFASLISKCWEQRGEDRLTISEAMDMLKNSQDAIINYKL